LVGGVIRVVPFQGGDGLIGPGPQGVALGCRVVAPLARMDLCANGAKPVSLGQRPRNTTNHTMICPERATPGHAHAQARDREQTIAGNVAEILEVPFPNPNGIESTSPGLRGTSYPGWLNAAYPTPTGLRQIHRACGRNPAGVGAFCGTVSQGSSFLATLGFGLESRWDSQMGARQARDREQTIAGNGAEILSA